MAYYAVYHTCAQLLQKEVQEGKSCQRITHRGLASELSGKEHTNSVLKNASKKYDGLLALRIKADYNLSECITAGHADDALEKAETILGISCVPSHASIGKLHSVR